MSAASLRARYLGDAVATSSPQQILVMLYDRLALDLERAQKAVAAGEREAAACRHASRSGSTTWRQEEMRLVSSLTLAWTSSPISQL